MSNSQMKQVGSHKTVVYTDNQDNIRVKYCETDVVVFNDVLITINSGGFGTPTTVRRIEQAKNQFNLPIPCIGYQDYNVKEGRNGMLVLISLNRKIRVPFTKLVVHRQTGDIWGIDDMNLTKEFIAQFRAQIIDDRFPKRDV